MLIIEKKKILKDYNTFGINQIAREFVSLENEQDLYYICNEYVYDDIIILGGGSNVLFTKDIDKIVVKINTKGKEIVEENKDFLFVKVKAGEVWHDFVMWCIDNNYGGIENLSLIPGSVGASPVQNIGAYGVEVKDIIEKVLVFDCIKKKKVEFSNIECEFGYRDSIFKKEKGRFIILEVVFKLTKINHKFNVSYGVIRKNIEENKYTIKNISDLIIKIRQDKLPNPIELGNAGSFFKNPVIENSFYEDLKKKYGEMNIFNQDDGYVKISAAWLIEQSGFKGKSFGKCGVYEKQALVLVNYGDSEGKDILKMAETIQNTVFEKYGIKIVPEINIF